MEAENSPRGADFWLAASMTQTADAGVLEENVPRGLNSFLN